MNGSFVDTRGNLCGSQVQVVPEGSMVTMDFDEMRVRIFVDEKRVVVKPPRLG